MRFADRGRPSPEINLTSLIDILFTVMLFLLLTTTFSDFTSIGVILPEAATGEADLVEPSRVRLVVNEDGSIRLGERSVTLDELADVLASIENPAGVQVHIAADSRAEHGRVVAIMDVARRAGIYRLNIQTRTSGPAADAP